MSYTVLYREYRPKNFSQIVGQDNIINILKNQIKTDSISHAYLFSGIRGTGKTSTAKVFAKSICCLNNKDGEACNECASCQNINSGESSDILEIDAASNRGIDEIRDLKEKVAYMPNFGKYKVYIIDEVHMLTNEAFNALLKTLEEPPQHVVFIFATTESNKILPTILSRCQRFDFARIEANVMVNHLSSILEQKQISYEKEALELIALTSSGALRDALTLLDKAIAISGGNVTKNVVDDVVGLVSEEDIESLANGILAKDVDKSIKAVNSFLEKGREVGSIITQLMEYFSNKIIAINVENPSSVINKSKDYIESLTKQFNLKEDSSRISDILYELANLKNDMRFFSDPSFIFNAKIINFCTLSTNNALSTQSVNSENTSSIDNVKIELLLDRISSLEKEVAKLSKLEQKVDNININGYAPLNESIKEQADEVIKTKHNDAKIVENIKDEYYVDRNKISKIEGIISTCVKYLQNRGGDFLVSTSISRFRVVSFEEGELIIYPASALNMMDLYYDNDGDKVFKDVLNKKCPENMKVKSIKYIDKKVKIKYNTSGSVNNSLKNLKEDLKRPVEKPQEKENNLNITSEDIINKENTIKKQEVDNDINIDPNFASLDEIYASNEGEEYISDEEFESIPNEIIPEEDEDASLKAIFGEMEEL